MLLIVGDKKPSAHLKMTNETYIQDSSNLELMIGCFTMLTNFSVHAYLLPLTQKSYGWKGVQRKLSNPLTLSPWG